MRVFRATLYPADVSQRGIGIGTAVTTVLRETDLECSLVEAIERLTATSDPPMWVTGDLFVVPDGTSIESAMFAAQQRQEAHAKDEKNQAVAFYCYAWALGHTRDDGVISTTVRAPLDTSALADIAAALVKHPAYRQQTVIQIARDGRIVRLTEGQVSIEGEASCGRE